MQLPPLPHLEDFAYLNHFKGPITQYLDVVSKPFETPFLAELLSPNPGETAPRLISQRVLVFKVKNSPIHVQIKHFLGTCPSLDYKDSAILLTEAIFSAHVSCKHKNGPGSSWEYSQASVTLHAVDRTPYLDSQSQLECNEDLLFRELGYDLVALGCQDILKDLLVLGHHPEAFTNLHARLEGDAPPNSFPPGLNLNDTYIWESLLLAKEKYPPVAQKLLEHFCHRPFHLKKSSAHQLTQHLEKCLHSAPATFPCPRCHIAFRSLGYPHFLASEELFLEYA